MSPKHAASKSLTAVAVALVGLAAAQPLCRASGRLPWAADTLIHLYRLVELDHLLRHGYLFPRWAPDLAYGYGFPLFNFYAPLSYYAAEVFRLIGMDLAPALLATFVALIVSAGLGMYAWAKQVWGRRAGLVAAAAYVTAPYLLYNVYHRGALAEMLAMALMPAILWAITQQARNAKSFAITTLLYAALFLGHNITALVFTPVVALYVVFLTMRLARRDTQYPRRNMYPLLHIALSLLLGLGLSTFFWVPAFFERNSVQIFQLFLPEGFDYHFNFVTPGELFSPPATVDPNLVLQPTPRSIGLIPLALAALAFALGWPRWDRARRGAAAFAAIVTLGSVFLTLPQSVAIWDALPLLRFVQFPWRFLSLTSLGVAFLAGGVLAEPLSPSRQDAQILTSENPGILASGWSISFLVVGMIVYGFTWQYVPYLAPITRPTVADIARYERGSGALGTTSAGDFMPNTVKKLPDANALVERYSRSDVIERLDLASLPASARVLTSTDRPLSADVMVESSTPFVATFDVFAFAGWQALVDGQPVAITPTDPYGLISIPVAAGQHRLQIFFGSTPLRTGAGAISLVSTVILIAASLVLRKSTSATTDHRLQTGESGPQSATGDWLAPMLVCLSVVCLVALKSFYLDARETLFRHTRFDGTRVASVAHPLDVNFDNQMVLMGFEPALPTTQMGDALQVTLYWRAARKLDVDYSISAQLVDERGFVYGQRDSQHPGGYPTSRWTLDDYARDVHIIAPMPGTPPGRYSLRIGVYRVGAASGLDVLDANGAPVGTTVDVATVLVTRPAGIGIPRRLTAPRPDHPSGAMLAPGLTLLGYDLLRTEVDAGAILPFTLYWQAKASQKRDLKARVQLVGPNGAAVLSADVVPISTQFPTDRLLAGDVMQGPNSVRIPASIPGGTFALRAALVDALGAAQGEMAELGYVTVRVPEREMNPPRVEHSTRADLGGEVRLIGYDLSAARLAPGASLTVTLYWQAQRELADDYKAFVHLLDASGRRIAGSDAVPANWTRPTTGWIAGEYVADPHTFALPGDLSPGNYQIEVGLYNADTAARLGDRVLLDQAITIAP